MKKLVVMTVLALGFPSEAGANDWEKFFRASPPGLTPILPSTQMPEAMPLPQDHLELVNSMWRKGFGLIGVSDFYSSNAKTKDAIRLGEKLRASFIVVSTGLVSSRTVDLPITTPTTTTSYSNGNVSAIGSGGTANGTYSGTTTTYGTTTSYIPIAVNRFEKVAAYFGPLAKQGIGLLVRAPTSDEVSHYGSRHLLVVRSVRDGSPADLADLLEGDTILKVNDVDASFDSFKTAVTGASSVTLRLVRGEQQRDVTVAVAQPTG